MLAIYTGRGVTPEVNLREYISHMPSQSLNKLPTLALKPRGDVTRSPKQGYLSPQKWICVQQKFLKKQQTIDTNYSNKKSKFSKHLPLNYSKKKNVRLQLSFILCESSLCGAAEIII